METINHECYVSLEVAKLLKKAGFNWFIRAAYRDSVLVFQENSLCDNFNGKQYENVARHEFFSAPTLEVAQRWLREVKGYDIEIYVCHHYGISAEKGYYHELVINNEDYEDDDISSQFSRTYEGAQEAGEKKALEMILKKGEYESN